MARMSSSPSISENLPMSPSASTTHHSGMSVVPGKREKDEYHYCYREKHMYMCEKRAFGLAEEHPVSVTRSPHVPYINGRFVTGFRTAAALNASGAWPMR